ncbi:MAG: helix-turn-helix domain-containing protein, partial [Calditrichaeota bacterium]
NGLEILNPRSKQFMLISSPLKPRLTSNWALTGIQDKNGDIWIGTREGLNRLCKSDWESGQYQFFHYLHRNYDSQNPRAKIVQTVFESSKGDLFAGTLDGLYRYAAERDTFDLVLTQEGASIKGIFRILEDDQESLWISTMNGLTKLEPSGRATQFDKSDGLQSDEFAFGALKCSSGQLYFGGLNGFNRFMPSEIIRDEKPPEVVLTDFLLFNRSAPLRTVINPKENTFNNYPLITIRPDQNVFSFEFAALDYANPAKCRYAYQMEGVDADWIFTDSGFRVAAYRNLAGGKYSFHVRAANGDGVWNDHGLRLNIRVIPPFWKSNWALALYLVSAAVILLLLRAVIIAKTHYEAELRMDQMKLNFFTHVSHEFRTPLTLILGPLSKILQDGETLPENKRLFYQAIISRSAKRLHHLIGQVMDLQKLEHGGPELEREWSNIGHLVQSIVESFSFLADSRQISLNFHCDEPEIWAMVDGDKIEKITYNLISNALNYTPAQKSVDVLVVHHKSIAECGHRKGMPKRYPLFDGNKKELVEISIVDTGVGIASKHLPHIFNRFYRGDHESGYGRPGTGVGLALSKQLAELHGGLLFVDSEVGKGSCFTLLLPISEDEKKDGIMNPPVTVSALDPPTPVQLPAESSAQADAPSILVIEDDLDMGLYIVGELSTDYAVMSVVNGQEGIKVAIERIPDLIICDVMMPEMSGFDVCRTIKADQRTSHIPMILLTARTEEESHLHGLQLGADDYVKKPFDPLLLRARVDNLLQTRKRLQEQFSRQILLQPAQVAVTSTEAQFLLKTMGIVEKNMGDEFFTVDVLAREIGLSRSQMYRKMQALTGQSPQELISEMRLQRAAQLLLTKQLTVSEIAYQTGFSDPAHFSKSFKKRFGCPPSSYQG